MHAAQTLKNVVPWKKAAEPVQEACSPAPATINDDDRTQIDGLPEQRAPLARSDTRDTHVSLALGNVVLTETD